MTAFISCLLSDRYPEIVSRVQALHGQLRKPVTVLDGTGVGKAAVELFRKSGFLDHVGESLRVPRRRWNVPLARESVTFRSKVARERTETAI